MVQVVSESRHHPILAPQDAWVDRRVLITGGTGFLGRHLVRRLEGLGANVTVALSERTRSDRAMDLPERVERQNGDVRNYAQIRRLVETAEPGIVFHLAAVGVNDPFIAEESALRVNLHGTLNTLRAVQRTRAGTEQTVQRIVVAGTSYEYGHGNQLDPGNVYAASKIAAWAFCRMYYRAFGTPVVVARPFNVFGPKQNPSALVPSAIRSALSGDDFAATPGEQLRDFVHVDDVVSGFLVLAVTRGLEGESVDLGTGRGTAVREIVQRIFSLTRSAGTPIIGALPHRPGVVWELVADAERTKRLTGWQAEVDLEEGLKTTIEAMR